MIVWLVAIAAVVWVVRNQLQKRRVAPPEDEWVLPPEQGTRAPVDRWEPDPFPVLDRDALLHRDRTLDPSAWDDSPDSLSGTDVDDPDAPAPEAEAPTYFDRSFLEKRAKDENP